MYDLYFLQAWLWFLIFKSTNAFRFILWFKISNIPSSILLLLYNDNIVIRHSDFWFKSVLWKIIVWVLLQFGTIDDSIAVIFRYYNISLVFCPRFKSWILNSENSLLIPLSRMTVYSKLYSDFDKIGFDSILRLRTKEFSEKFRKKWFYGISPTR